jgi:hypothetical protein
MKGASGVSPGRVVGAWRVALGSVRLRVAALSITAIALSGLGASTASASDTFWLNNSTGTSFTQRLDCSSEPVCPSAWQQGALLAAGQSNPGISVTLGAGSDFDTNWTTSGGVHQGDFVVAAVDPVFKSAYLNCYGSVRGFDCYVTGLNAYFQQTGSALPGRGRHGQAPVAARFWSSLAPVGRSGIAFVPVASYSTRRRGAVRERVVLRSPKGAVIGRGEKTVRFNTRTNIDVRLTPTVARTIASGKTVNIRASVTHADGTKGTGQTTKALTLTKLTPGLRGLLLPG